MCLNTNDSIRIEDGFVVVGGFVCDHNEGWILDFSIYLGSCTVIDAKFWGILDDLKPIQDQGYKRVLIQTDSLEVVNAIQDYSFRGSNFALVRKIHQLLKIVRHWKIQHIPRDENKIVNGLVKMIRDMRTRLRLFEDFLLKELV